MQSILLDIPETKEDYSYLESISLYDVLNRLGINADRYSLIRCPLHNDKTPSFKIYDNNSWACFGVGCGNKAGINGGGIVEFVRQKFNYSFWEAKEWLEQNFIFNPFIPEKKPEKKKVKPVIAPDNVLYWHSLLDSFNKRDFFHKRGFTDATINEQLLGYDSKRFVIPVWDGLPQQSEIIGIRRRKRPDDVSNSPKYIGLEGLNQACVYGKYSCIGKELIIAFAGELDALRAIQDALASFSVVNGVNSFRKFPKNWPDLWFPDSKYLAVAFDKKEESVAGQFAEDWNRTKGSFTGRVMHYPLDFSGKDFCDWRDSGRTASEFYERVLALF